MTMYRPNSPPTHNRQRSSSHPVRPQRVRTPSETNESVPVRPPRNPARPATLGEEQLAPPPVVSKPTRTSGDDHREGEIGGDSRYIPPVNVLPPKSPVNRKQSPQATPLPQINTLDRKILQELRRSMLARSAQFTLKNNTKHHPFPPDEVPYPRSYDHKCIDTDVWETVFCEQFCRNVTFHTFDVLPTKVLDLGCGSGSWIMACARRWKDCHFVGLDIVPLHPDLGQSELRQRVSWVQANFLEALPFPNGEFDFVHIKRIARGVPEHKWDALFEEIIRVMKPGAALEMLEEDLYIPGQTMDSADSDSPPSAASSSGSSEELSQPYVPSIPGPSTSLPDISAEYGYSNSQMIRRSTSERHKKRPPAGPATSNMLPPPLPIHPTPSKPDYSRAFPRPRTSNSTVRHSPSHFNLHNLLPKRSGRDDGAGTDGEQPRKPKKDSTAPVSLSAGPYPLSVSGGSATLDMRQSAKGMRRPASSGGRLPSSKPYFGATGTSSSSIFGSSMGMAVLPMPTQKLHGFGERVHPLTLPPVESTNGRLEVDFPQNGQNEDPRQARTRSLSCPTPEDDGQRRSIASHESEQFDLSTVGMHDHAQQVRSSNVRNSRNSGILTDMELVESNRLEKMLTVVPPAPPPKDIPGRSRPQAIRPSSSSSNEASSSTAGLSRSVPDRIIDRFDRNGDQTLSLEVSKPTKSLSTSSLAISASHSTGQVRPLLQNHHLNDNSTTDNAVIHSPSTEIPPNPREHKLLEVIYTEMHAARFVNLAPLSLLENYIRTYFGSVRTHAPLIFAFPPPPGCEHRPEFDATELQQGKLNQNMKAERDDDQDRYLGPDTLPFDRSLIPSPGLPQLNNLESAPGRPTRERNLSITNNEPRPLRSRPSGTKPIRPSTADPSTANHWQLSSGGSKNFVGPGCGTLPGRLVITGEGLVNGTSEYVTMDKSMIGGFSPARVARAAGKRESSASDERERSRQRSDSLFTRSTDAQEKGEGGEARKRSLTPIQKLARPSTAGSLPLSSTFGYENHKATSLISLSPSTASSSTSTIVQRDSGKGKRRLGVAEGAQLSALPNKKAEIDIRSLNIHLRARVVEILGCSEAMWDWVREFQSRESEKERKRKEQMVVAAKKVQGVGGGRVSYFHHDHVRNHGGRERMDSGESDQSALHRKRSAKSFTVGASRRKPGDGGQGLTGDGQRTFVKVSGYVAECPSSYFTTSFGSAKGDDPSEHIEKSVKQELLHMTRERFDEVLSWFQFDMDDSIRLTRSMATRTLSTSFTTDLTEERKSFDIACQKLDTHFQQHPKRPTSLIEPDDIVNGCGSASGSPRHSQHSEEELCCLPPLLNLVHPSKRLCRTIRVWVAWKP
ncbi:hypothetical protein BDM02DRAFT_3121636 [Thelephora ganbajun]|uniref:Uncharacterized protein n=1 Tax=Thelephora ganbajun TaxID=370292 RepID=A0ACB6Z4X3_THEGA|nr:hypothetical protein BDM02DRAFT_3121636 [Thelephora ganbajun]